MSRRSGKPTIKDVAAAAGVSLGTASRVVNQFADVNPEMRQRVERAIERLGYLPDAVAQSMRSRSTRTVGILIRDFSPSAFASFGNAAQTQLFSHGYVPLLAGYNDQPQRELEILQAFVQRRIDGLIVTTSSGSNHELAEARRRLGVPLILFDRDPEAGHDTIAIDHRGGILAAGRYLFALGHVRIALLSGQADVRPTRERVAAYEALHHAARMALDPALLRTGSFSAEFAQRETEALLAMPKRPTAIVCGGVNMLPGVLRGIRAAGLRIPEDVSVISSTNFEIAELVTPAVTELRVEYGDIGAQSAQLMMGRLEGKIEGPPRVLEFGTTLIERASCGPPPASRSAAKPAARTARRKPG